MLVSAFIGRITSFLEFIQDLESIFAKLERKMFAKNIGNRVKGRMEYVSKKPHGVHVYSSCIVIAMIVYGHVTSLSITHSSLS